MELKRQDRNGERTFNALKQRYKFDINQEEVESLKELIKIDSSLSITSVNAVENKVVTQALNGKVAKEQGKGLSSNDFTDNLKSKLDGVESNAEENVIEIIKLNGTTQTVTNKEVDLDVEVETVLYSNSSGTASNFLLSQSKDNFTYVEIHGFETKSNTKFCTGKIEVSSGNNDVIGLQVNRTDNSYIYLYGTSITINGTNVSFGAINYGVCFDYSTGNIVQDTDKIKVTKVVGYK